MFSGVEGHNVADGHIRETPGGGVTRLCRAERPAVRGRLAVGDEGFVCTPIRVLLPGLALLYAAGGMMVGLPLHEPVVRYGPFVMNTEAEIRQALLDYQSGWMGVIAV
jgi:hypothetical protein